MPGFNGSETPAAALIVAEIDGYLTGNSGARSLRSSSEISNSEIVTDQHRSLFSPGSAFRGQLGEVSSLSKQIRSFP
jgi:hypothetical protein